MVIGRDEKSEEAKVKREAQVTEFIKENLLDYPFQTDATVNELFSLYIDQGPTEDNLSKVLGRMVLELSVEKHIWQRKGQSPECMVITEEKAKGLTNIEKVYGGMLNVK